MSMDMTITSGTSDWTQTCGNATEVWCEGAWETVSDGFLECLSVIIEWARDMFDIIAEFFINAWHWMTCAGESAREFCVRNQDMLVGIAVAGALGIGTGATATAFCCNTSPTVPIMPPPHSPAPDGADYRDPLALPSGSEPDQVEQELDNSSPPRSTATAPTAGQQSPFPVQRRMSDSDIMPLGRGRITSVFSPG